LIKHSLLAAEKKTLVEVLFDRYSPTPYHYVTPKVGHLPPVKCAPSPASS